MPLKLMYITNSPEVAQIAESTGVDRIFIDMEYIGKAERQGGMDTVQSHHTIQDIRNIRGIVRQAEIMVRINPIHSSTDAYCLSKKEIDAAIDAGADILMLPYFKSVYEVEEFIKLVDGRARTFPLVETPEAVSVIDEILALSGIDEIFIGLNDLSLGYGMQLMFELLADGTVERLCYKFKKAGIPYGFGGIASVGKGVLPAEKIIKEHYRLGSSSVILSRSFCNLSEITDLNEIHRIFSKGIKDIRSLEDECQTHADFFRENMSDVKRIVDSLHYGN